MKLYYSPGACSLATDIVLHEGGFSPDLVKVDLKSKHTEAGADFWTVNPKGYVPALVLDDGQLLTENVAILQYLASLVPRLLPQEGMAKWRGIEWLAYVSTELHKAYKPLFDPSASEEQKKKAKDTVARRLTLLEERLSNAEFVVGDDFSVVDAYLFVMLRWAQQQGIPVPSALTRYAERLSSRPSVRAALVGEGLSAAK
jgi:glutathione S-transferase